MPTAKTTDSTNHAQKILLQLKQDFLRDMPDRHARIEELILALQKSRNFEHDFDDLYRNVHSLKGSAGTFGVRTITTVCHHLEDHLNLLNDDFSNLDNEYIDTCLSYIDLIRQTYLLEINDDHDSVAIEETLKILRNDSLRNKYSGLIVTGSNLMNQVCQSALEKLPVQLAMADDGLDALDRLMRERYDFVVMSNEISVLNGTAVTYALRASKSANHNVAIILVTARDNAHFIDELAPDHIIKKDQKLGDNLTRVTKQITDNLSRPPPQTNG